MSDLARVHSWVSLVCVCVFFCVWYVFLYAIVLGRLACLGFRVHIGIPFGLDNTCPAQKGELAVLSRSSNYHLSVQVL